MHQNITSQEVKNANKELYDSMAGDYERIDGRRSPVLEKWLHKKLEKIRSIAPGGSMLDVGTGSGLVTRCCSGLFDLRIGTDLSFKIIKDNKKSFEHGIVSDVDDLPFADESFDVVTCFSVLHHLFSFEGLANEVFRILRPNGIFYSDHDMDSLFNNRFKIPLSIYRRFRSYRTKSKSKDSLSQDLYNLSEFHSDGIDFFKIKYLFESQGFCVKTDFHWFGLTPMTDKIFGSASFAHGWAPLVSLLCFKKANGPVCRGEEAL